MEHSEDSVQNITYTTEKEMSVKCIALQCNVDVEDLIRWNAKEYPDLKPSDKFKATLWFTFQKNMNQPLFKSAIVLHFDITITGNLHCNRRMRCVAAM